MLTPQRLYVDHTHFKFDRVFDEGCSSDEVYDDCVAQLVERAAAGDVPACVLMYGQTGSGKTFTMRAIMKRNIRAANSTFS